MSSMAPPGKVMEGQFESDDRLGDQGGDAYDVLRDLFLGSEEEAAAAPPSAPAATPASGPALDAIPRSTPFIDALVLGHLPVLQSAWVMQYARDTAAQKGGPVALIRVRAEETTIDLVGLGATKAPEPATTLADALSAAAGIVSGFILRVDATNEPSLAKLETVDTLTLLTGADEVAVLASYQTVKKLFPASDEDGPAARLAIMGASPQKAMEAAGKLEKTAAAFLDRPITISACVARIGPGKSSLLFRGPAEGNMADLVDRIRASRPARVAVRSKAPEVAPAAPVSHPAPMAAAIPEPATVVSRLGHIQHEPRPQASPASSPADPHPLVAHMKGLSGTAIRCPYEPAIEFALDSRGGLHLLTHADEAPAAAVSSLLAAGGWAKAHLSLITMAIKGQGINQDERVPPTLHILTPSVKQHRALSDAGIRLHLLARVEVEGHKGWFCTEVG